MRIVLYLNTLVKVSHMRGKQRESTPFVSFQANKSLLAMRDKTIVEKL